MVHFMHLIHTFQVPRHMIDLNLHLAKYLRGKKCKKCCLGTNVTILMVTFLQQDRQELDYDRNFSYIVGTLEFHVFSS